MTTRIVLLAFILGQSTAVEQVPQEQLQKLGDLIGEWRGTGQERRGSTRGAWRQTGEFVWDFSDKTNPAIRYVVSDGKLTTEARVTWSAEKKAYQLLLNTPNEGQRQYMGNWDGNKLVFQSERTEGRIYQLTLTPLNEKRTLVLHEKTSDGGDTFFRIAEVGYTRAGTRLAVPGGGRRECVVTGGTANTPVMYQGQTYYVCCSGCKQAFEDDPAGIIADFEARLAERKANAATGR